MSAAIRECRCHRPLLRPRHPELILGLDEDLGRYIGAGEAAVVGKLPGGVIVSLRLILRSVDGE
jgi:hypothetical protein